MRIVGIYKIQSPSGKVYIGQSIDIFRRFRVYKSAGCNGQPYLFNSFEKYGRNSHSFEILHELPQDVSQEVLNEYEVLYISCFRNAGINCLNIREGGSRGKHSEESKALISAANSTAERKEAASRAMSKMLQGNQNGKCNKGRICSNEKKEKLRQHFTGKTHSVETKELVSKIGKRIWENRSQEEMGIIARNRKEAVSYKSKKVINTQTGEVFNSAKGAAIFYGLNPGSAHFIATASEFPLRYLSDEFSSRKGNDPILCTPVEIRPIK